MHKPCMLLFHRAVERCVLAQLGRSVHALPIMPRDTQVTGCAQSCHDNFTFWAYSLSDLLTARTNAATRLKSVGVEVDGMADR